MLSWRTTRYCIPRDMAALMEGALKGQPSVGMAHNWASLPSGAPWGEEVDKPVAGLVGKAVGSLAHKAGVGLVHKAVLDLECKVVLDLVHKVVVDLVHRAVVVASLLDRAVVGAEVVVLALLTQYFLLCFLVHAQQLEQYIYIYIYICISIYISIYIYQLRIIRL